MGFIQRLLARRGYIRLSDYGLVLTPYGVLPARDRWQPEAAYVQGPLQASPVQAAPAAIAKTASSVSAARLQESSAPLGKPSTRADSDTDGNTTLAQPLSEYRPPLAPETAPPGDARSKWPKPAALATIMIDTEPASSLMQYDEDDKTLFSDPPHFEARSATPS